MGVNKCHEEMKTSTYENIDQRISSQKSGFESRSHPSQTVLGWFDFSSWKSCHLPLQHLVPYIQYKKLYTPIPKGT